MRWAIVTGVDEYGSDGMRLHGAVSDALWFRDWVCEHGDVPEDNLRLLPGFSELHTDDPLAVRSLAEHSETTPLGSCASPPSGGTG